jgi:hypothetical protein
MEVKYRQTAKPSTAHSRDSWLFIEVSPNSQRVTLVYTPFTTMAVASANFLDKAAIPSEPYTNFLILKTKFFDWRAKLSRLPICGLPSIECEAAILRNFKTPFDQCSKQEGKRNSAARCAWKFGGTCGEVRGESLTQKGARRVQRAENGTMLDGNLKDLYHRVAEVGRVHSAVQRKLLAGEPGVRCGVLEQSVGLVWFRANRKPRCLACC